jgi:hypothetical protein
MNPDLNETALPTLFDADEIERSIPNNEILRPHAAHGATDPDPRHPLERDFPRVMKGIVTLWGTDMCAEYLRSLVMMKPGEKRQGFPMHLVEDLLLLDRCNSELLNRRCDR